MQHLSCSGDARAYGVARLLFLTIRSLPGLDLYQNRFKEVAVPGTVEEQSLHWELESLIMKNSSAVTVWLLKVFELALGMEYPISGRKKVCNSGDSDTSR